MATSQDLALIFKAQNETKAAFDALHHDVEGLSKKFSGLGQAAMGLAAGISIVKEMGSAVAGLAGALLQDAISAEKVGAQLDAVLKSTGGAAGVTREEVLALSDALSKVAPFEDEVITSTQNMLLTFTNIGRDIMPQATEAVLNMATALGEDTQSAAIRLGKALNDPIEGVTALKRVGVQLSDQQQELVKHLIATGQGAEAQKVILQELEVEFGNSARAAGETFSGQLTILNTQLGNVKETIGGPLLSVLSDLLGQMIPTITAFAEAEDGAKHWADVIQGELIPAAQDFWLDNLVPLIGQMQDGLPGAIEDGKVALSQLGEGLGLAARAAGGLGGAIDNVIANIGALAKANQDMRREFEEAGAPFDPTKVLPGDRPGNVDRNTVMPPGWDAPILPSASDIRAAQRAGAEASAWYWANSDDAEAEAWRASKTRTRSTSTVVPTREEKKGGGSSAAAKAAAQSAIDGFMSAAVGAASQYEGAFGKEGGKLASALAKGLTDNSESSGAAVRSALDSVLTTAREAGVPEWQAAGDELAGALHDALVARTPEMKSAALELVRGMDLAIREAKLGQAMGVAWKAAEDAVNVSLENIALAMTKVNTDAETAMATLDARLALSDARSAARAGMGKDAQTSMANLTGQHSEADRARLAARTDTEIEIANRKALAAIEGSHLANLQKISMIGKDVNKNVVASEAPRLAAAKAEAERYTLALAQNAARLSNEEEDRRRKTTYATEDAAAAAANKVQVETLKTVIDGVLTTWEKTIAAEDLAAVKAGMVATQVAAIKELQQKHNDLVDAQQSKIVALEKTLRESLKLTADTLYDGMVEDLEEAVRLSGELAGGGPGGAGTPFAPTPGEMPGQPFGYDPNSTPVPGSGGSAGGVQLVSTRALSAGSSTQVIFNAPVYGFPDFEQQVVKAVDMGSRDGSLHIVSR